MVRCIGGNFERKAARVGYTLIGSFRKIVLWRGASKRAHYFAPDIAEVRITAKHYLPTEQCDANPANTGRLARISLRLTFRDGKRAALNGKLEELQPLIDAGLPLLDETDKQTDSRPESGSVPPLSVS